MDKPHGLDLGRIAQDLQIRKLQVESIVQLLDEGNTIPFIARFRRDRTGGLDEDVIRSVQRRVAQQRHFAERKQTILKTIQNQGKLTDALRDAVLATDLPKKLEDLYLPFKPKKRNAAAEARERGLEPLALAIWTNDSAVSSLPELLPTLVNPEKGLNTPDDVMNGVKEILAEHIAEIAEVRQAARMVMWDNAKLLTSKAENLAEEQGKEFKDYFQFGEPVRQVPPHRVLAINRGEKENVLKARIDYPGDLLEQAVLSKLPLADHPHGEFLKTCSRHAITQWVVPSMEREIRRELTDEAEDHAVQVFSRNLRSLLLQPPVRGRRVLAIDPGFRTGCRVAVLDENGHLLAQDTLHPHGSHPRREKKGGKRDEAKPELAQPAPLAPLPATPLPEAAAAEPAAVATESVVTPPAPADPSPEPAAPIMVPEVQATEATAVASEPVPAAVVPNRRDEAKTKLEELIHSHQVNLIAIGSGQASRETEELVAALITERLPDVAYVIVNEAGASHYATSPIGREEFPDFDAALRGTISIGRRLQDPLGELVKIDPQNIGVGLYQHDIGQKRLKDSLDAVIESCVNTIGVDLNTAGIPLLRYVAGLNQLLARNIAEHRKQHGPFANREQLKQVAGIAEANYCQAAGFVRVQGGEQPLDNTWIHPENYPLACQVLERTGAGPDGLRDAARLEELRAKLSTVHPEDVAKQVGLSPGSSRDLLEALAYPGSDPRDELPQPVFKKGVLKIEDLRPNMELKGTVLNVVDFGAFVDVGLKDSGLVHISQLANRYIKSPYEVVSVGDVVTVWVLTVDAERQRVSLTMIRPGTERKPLERRPRPERARPQGRPQGQVQGQGRGQGRGPRPGARPAAQPAAVPAVQGGQAQEPAAAAQSQPERPKPPPPRPQPQRPPRRERPKPKLSEEALQGSAPLRSFAELAAFLEATKKQE